MVDDVPYNTRCRIAAPTYFLEGIFRQADQEYMFSLLEIAALTLQTVKLVTGELQGDINTRIGEAAQKRFASFLFYSGGRPALDIYDLDSLEKDPVLKVVPTFNTSETGTVFPLYGWERRCASFRLWLAGIEGPDSYVQKE